MGMFFAVDFQTHSIVYIEIGMNQKNSDHHYTLARYAGIVYSI